MASLGCWATRAGKKQQTSCDAQPEESRGSAAGAAFRTATQLSINPSLRAFSRIVRAVGKGRIPSSLSKVNVRSLSQTSRRATRAWTAFQHWVREVDEEPSNGRGPKITASRAAKGFVRALPDISRSFLLGAVLFKVYDSSSTSLKQRFMHHTKDVVKLSSPNYFSIGSVSLIAGAAGGLAQGALNTAFDCLSERQFTYFRCLLNPTLLVQHALAHAALFSCFELSKTFLLERSEAQRTHSKGVVCVATAGFLGGFLREVIAQVIAEHGLRKFLWKSYLKAAIPTAVGFLAFEYAQ